MLWLLFLERTFRPLLSKKEGLSRHCNWPCMQAWKILAASPNYLHHFLLRLLASFSTASLLLPLSRARTLIKSSFRPLAAK
ncbi:Protein of unknown function [Cotesia congregata]|uniref:Uncharacterized protein n=1 Tax=Cotesia congregata TaxID=51543 RepID=A0A8J2EP58_COTCN|nr:Protein of unknown function [Cotesia congregata]